MPEIIPGSGPSHEKVEHARRFLPGLRVPEGWVLFGVEVESPYGYWRGPVIDVVHLHFASFRGQKLDVRVHRAAWKPEWLTALLMVSEVTPPGAAVDIYGRD